MNNLHLTALFFLLAGSSAMADETVHPDQKENQILLKYGTASLPIVYDLLDAVLSAAKSRGVISNINSIGTMRGFHQFHIGLHASQQEVRFRPLILFTPAEAILNESKRHLRIRAVPVFKNGKIDSVHFEASKEMTVYDMPELQDPELPSLHVFFFTPDMQSRKEHKEILQETQEAARGKFLRPHERTVTISWGAPNNKQQRKLNIWLKVVPPQSDTNEIPDIQKNPPDMDDREKKRNMRKGVDIVTFQNRRMKRALSLEQNPRPSIHILIEAIELLFLADIGTQNHSTFS